MVRLHHGSFQKWFNTFDQFGRIPFTRSHFLSLKPIELLVVYIYRSYNCFNLYILTSLLLSGNMFVIFANGGEFQFSSVFITTIRFTLKFLVFNLHLLLSCNITKSCFTPSTPELITYMLKSMSKLFTIHRWQKSKRTNLKMDLRENKALQIFRKKDIFYPVICTSTFLGKFEVLYFLVTPVLRLSLFPSYLRHVCYFKRTSKKFWFIRQ